MRVTGDMERGFTGVGLEVMREMGKGEEVP